MDQPSAGMDIIVAESDLDDALYHTRIRMNMAIRLAYMGIPGSNSEQAAVELAGAMGWLSRTLIPKEDSRNTIAALDSGEADYGVVASSNITAGPVIETEEALKERDDIETLRALWLPIHHCVFALRPDCGIMHVASHIQALLQTKNHLSELFPDADRIEVSDTAVPAEMLSDGRLTEDTAVVCRRNAGEMFGLSMLYENIEDLEGNMTEFKLLRLKR